MLRIVMLSGIVLCRTAESNYDVVLIVMLSVMMGDTTLSVI
jgi:hypothetical protein